ncbi:tetratricopeptide repeat protein [Halobacteriovorax sp. CON-3]|uniref:tetratricopeptide repeat protein n=1 Tax=Halobacteriovorax sp. CON-3 TaxID=3157710 RepID=UPI00371D0DFE
MKTSFVSKFLIIILVTLSAYSSNIQEVIELIKSRNYQEAESKLDQLPKDAHYYTYQGLLKELANDFSHAEKAYERAISTLKTNYDREWVFEHLIRVQYLQNNLNSALKTCDAGLEEFPTSKELNNLKLYVKNLKSIEYEKQFSKVNKEYENSHYMAVIEGTNKLNEKDFNLRLLRFYSFVNLNRNDEAKKEITKLKKYFEYHPSVIQAEVDFYVKVDDLNKLRRLSTKVAGTNVDSFSIHYQLGYLYLKKGKNKEARQELEKAIQIDHKRHEAYELLGYLDAVDEDYNEAIERYKRAISLYTNDVNTFLSLDQIYGKTNQIDERIAVLERVSDLFPNNTNVNIRLGFYYELQNELETSKKYYEKALKSAPESNISKEAIERINRKRKSIVYAEYRYEHLNTRLFSPTSYIDSTFKINRYSIANQINFKDYFKFGLLYQKAIGSGDSSSNYDVQNSGYAGYLNYQRSRYYLSFVLGQTFLEEGYDQSNDDNYVVGSLVGSYRADNGQLTFLVTSDIKTTEDTLNLNVEKSKLYNLQYLFGVNERLSLLTRAAFLKAESYEYMYYTLASVYKLENLKGLSFRAIYDFIDDTLLDLGGNQYSLGILWNKSLSDRLNFNFNSSISYLDRGDIAYFSNELVTTYQLEKNINPILTLSYEDFLNDEDESEVSLRLGIIISY